MDLDLPQIEAFVEAADQEHFGRAAARLYLTQQALSKRIARLEQVVGEPLFARIHNRVELTAAGRAFLPHARRLLTTARETADAVAALRARPLRLDVWGQVQTPLRVLSGLLSRMVPEPAVELSMRRSLPAALEAVGRGELDGVFGRPYDLPRGLPAGLARRPFVLDSLDVIATDGHPFAACRQITAAQLRETGLWYPLNSRSNAPELVGWLRRYAAQNAVPLTLAGINLGLEQLLTELPKHHPAVSLVPDAWQIPADSGIVRIPLQPAAHFLWWFIWPERSSHPVLEQFNVLLDRIAGPWNGLGRPDGWLPEPDAADLPWAPPGAGR